MIAVLTIATFPPNLLGLICAVGIGGGLYLASALVLDVGQFDRRCTVGMSCFVHEGAPDVGRSPDGTPRARLHFTPGKNLGPTVDCGVCREASHPCIEVFAPGAPGGARHLASTS